MPPEALPEMVGFSKEVIDGFEIYSLPIADNLGLDFSIKDKKLIFTFSKDILVEILKNLDNQKLKDSKIFSEQFKEIPKEVSEISFTYPYGFLGVIKNLANFYFGMMESSSPEMTAKIETASPYIEEFLNKAIVPYLKVLKSASAFSYSPEKGLVIAKSKLQIEELPAEEKKSTEEFLDNLPNWEREIEEIESAPEIPETPPQIEEKLPEGVKSKEYEIFSQEIAYRGTVGKDARLPMRNLFIPPTTQIYKVEAYLKAFNSDPFYSRSAGIMIAPETGDCRAKYYLTLSSKEIDETSFDLETNWFKPGINSITSWVSTYREYGPDSWVTLKLKIYYKGEPPTLFEGILKGPIDPISCTLG
jgi:hypothetical protein